MWLTVLVLAIVATADPVRIGVSVLLSARPRALGALVSFWLGGMSISIVIAAGVLFGVHDAALAALHRVQLATATSTAGHIQIAMGVLALLIAAFSVGLWPGHRPRPGMPVGHTFPLPGRTPAMLRSTVSRMSVRAHDVLDARPLRVAFALGFGMLVDFRFLAALAAILASGAAVGQQIGAAGLYALIALAFVEVPLISQLAAPARTDQVMSAVSRWVGARRQHVFAFVIGLLGVFLMTRGIGHA